MRSLCRELGAARGALAQAFSKKGSVRMCQAYIRIKLRTGLRQTDLLQLRTSDFGEVGINVTASKTANSTRVKQTFTWLDEEGHDTGLRAAVDEALTARPIASGPGSSVRTKGSATSTQMSGGQQL